MGSPSIPTTSLGFWQSPPKSCWRLHATTDDAHRSRTRCHRSCWSPACCGRKALPRQPRPQPRPTDLSRLANGAALSAFLFLKIVKAIVCDLLAKSSYKRPFPSHIFHILPLRDLFSMAALTTGERASPGPIPLNKWGPRKALLLSIVAPVPVSRVCLKKNK